MRWWILAVLFIARFAMAFQFQSVAALSPVVAQTYGVGLAEIGFLIGLYLAPGVLVALPGGTIAARFGEPRVVAAGLVLMFAGSLITHLSPSWEAAVSGRVLAGAGGVVVNIVMTKLLIDWFAGREISTAMAIFVNSWPVGIAVALLVLPIVAEAGGLGATRLLTLGLIAVGFGVFVLFYRVPEGATAGPQRLRFVAFPVIPLMGAMMVWALYNAALSMVFSFGPALLAARGWELQAASSTTSLFILVACVTVPIGGIVADLSGRRDMVIAVSLISFVILMPFVPSAPASAVFALLIVTGGVFGLAAGPIMTLPSDVLPPEARGFGMGIFFTAYYAVMMFAPSLAGAAAEASGNVATAFYIGAGMSAAALAFLGLFRQRRRALV